MKLVRGDKLPEHMKEEVLRAYIYRITPEDEYLKDNAFYVTDKGCLSRRHKHSEPAYMATD